MALPFLSTLSAAARLAYPAIVGGVRRGFSANKIQSILQATGIGVRRSTLLNIVARSRAIFGHGSYLRGLRKGQRPNVFALPEALTRLTRQFAFTYKVEGTATDTGLPMSQYITLAMDKLKTGPEMQAEAVRIAEEGKERYDMDALRAIAVDGVQAGPLGVL